MMYQKRRELKEKKCRRKLDEGIGTAIDGRGDIVVIDLGGGQNSTITAKAWHVFEENNHTLDIKGHSEKGKGKTCKIVNAAIKAWI
eukprot:2547846-Ditylum_brightwellii.AAC.1